MSRIEIAGWVGTGLVLIISILLVIMNRSYVIFSGPFTLPFIMLIVIGRSRRKARFRDQQPRQ